MGNYKEKEDEARSKADGYKTKIVSADIKRRPKFTLVAPKKKKFSGSEKKDSRQKCAMQVLREKFERCDFLKSLTYTPPGITFGQIANGDVAGVKKEL